MRKYLKFILLILSFETIAADFYNDDFDPDDPSVTKTIEDTSPVKPSQEELEPKTKLSDLKKTERTPVLLFAISKRGNLAFKSNDSLNYNKNDILVFEISEHTFVRVKVLNVNKNIVLTEPMSDAILFKTGTPGLLYPVRFFKKELEIIEPQLISYRPSNPIFELNLMMGYKIKTHRVQGHLGATNPFVETGNAYPRITLVGRPLEDLWIGVEAHYTHFSVRRAGDNPVNRDRFNATTLGFFMKYSLIKSLEVLGGLKREQEIFINLNENSTNTWTINQVAILQYHLGIKYTHSFTPVLRLSGEADYLMQPSKANENIKVKSNQGRKFGIFGFYDFEKITVFAGNELLFKNSHTQTNTQKTQDNSVIFGLQKQL